MPNYTQLPYHDDEYPEYDDDVMTVEDFIQCVRDGLFNDDDGSGCPMKDGKYDRHIIVLPSNYRISIPADATHIVWFNK